MNAGDHDASLGSGTPRSVSTLLLALATLLAARPVDAQGAWTPTGSMTTPRAFHTSTLLPDGTVLVAGGQSGASSTSSAELYDPSAGTWSATGSMLQARAFHTATLLPNGKVLVAGGGATGNSAELYEPFTGLWTAASPMNTSRSLHTATLLPNGTVLVVGGNNSRIAETYDPALGAWTATGLMNFSRSAHTATLLANGQVLVASAGSAEIYDPASRAWTLTGAMIMTRVYHTATLLPNGKVLVVGGNGGTFANSSAEIYDPASGTWSMTTSMTQARARHTGTRLPGGSVLVAGGVNSIALASSELYDPAAATWTPQGSMSVTRWNAAATLLPNGKVLVDGGIDNGVTTASADLYAPLPVAALGITKTDGQTTAQAGQTVTYTIVVTNAGPAAANGAHVTDTIPASLVGAQWTCVGGGGATCTAGPVSGDVDDTVNLPAGATATYALTAQVAANASNLSNTASVSAPSDVFDPNAADNTATDTDTLVCAGERVLVADGRRATAVIAPGETQWFGAGLKIGDSYSLEFKNAQLDTPASQIPPGALTVFKGDDGCSGTSTLTVTDTTASDPAAAPTGVRVSFTASGTSTFFRAKLVNPSAASIVYNVTWADTTQYSAAWSTYGPYNTYYSVENTTRAPITGKLLLFDLTGGVAGTSTFTIPAGEKMSTNTATLGIVRNQTGTARFTHDGPPRAVVIEAAIADFSQPHAYVQPVKFRAVRETR